VTDVFGAEGPDSAANAAPVRLLTNLRDHRII
jgi:hypothetical protein